MTEFVTLQELLDNGVVGDTISVQTITPANYLIKYQGGGQTRYYNEEKVVITGNDYTGTHTIVAIHPAFSGKYSSAKQALEAAVVFWARVEDYSEQNPDEDIAEIKSVVTQADVRDVKDYLPEINECALCEYVLPKTYETNASGGTCKELCPVVWGRDELNRSVACYDTESPYQKLELEQDPDAAALEPAERLKVIQEVIKILKTGLSELS